MIDTAIQVRTEHFDGPLALLLHLIDQEEMDIKNLDLRVITGQYLSFITQMHEMNFDMAGDYLYLAATLLLLKSNVCLSFEDQEKLKQMGDDQNLNIVSQAELIRRLEELQHFQKMAQKLWQLPKKGHDIFVKPRTDRKAIINSILTPMDLQALTNTMVDLLKRERRKYAVVKRDRLSIKERLQTLQQFLKKGEQTALETIITHDGDGSLENIVITFISLLELARLGKVSIFQNENYSTVYVDVLESLENFNVEMATGFDDEQAKTDDAVDLDDEEEEDPLVEEIMDEIEEELEAEKEEESSETWANGRTKILH
ncbi:MAG: hypothetical protein A2X86_12085 [Bdellovibrionales bacterium GWA2_49_15]|nr:MAG: hypothetical protein A2X86_12085 [Bdellovibrionales bacterium GWA2_49_15]